MHRKKLYLPSMLLAMTALIWAVVGDDGQASPESSLQHSAAGGGVNATAQGSWDDVSPFGVLTCQLTNGEKVNTTACNQGAENHQNVNNISDARPEVRISALLKRIESGEFDRYQDFAGAYYDCWFMRSRALNATGTPDQGAESDCDLKAVQSVVEKASSSILAAANRGDFVARETHVALLMSKVEIDQMQLEFYKAASKDERTLQTVGTLTRSIDAARGQIVSFIRSLKNPSDDLANTLDIYSYVKTAVDEPKSAEPVKNVN